MSHSRMICGALAALLAGSALLGCSPTDEASVNAQRQQARAFVEKKQFQEAIAAYRQVVQLDPKDDEAYYQLALLHLALGTPDDIRLAQQELLKVVKLKGTRSDAHLTLGHLYLLGGEHAKARLHADAILASEPGRFEAFLLRGVSYVREKQFQNGISEFRKAIEAAPHEDAAYLELARAYALQGNFPEAESTLRKSIDLESASIERTIALGDVYVAAGKDSEAVKEYLRGLTIDHARGELYSRLVQISLRQRRLSEAEGYYRQWIEAVPTGAQAHEALAQFYRSTGKLNDAETSLQRALQLDPSSRVAREALITLYLETARLEEAGAEIDRLLKPNPLDLAGRIFQAWLARAQGDLDRALHLLQQLVRQAPKSAVVHYHLGLALAQRQDLPQAVSALKEARSLAPDSSDIRMRLAQVYLTQGSLGPAMREAEAIIQANPQDVAARKLLVEAHLLAGDVKRAHVTLDELSKLMPGDPFVHHRLGVVFRMQQRQTEAMAHFERVLQSTPGSVEALEEIVSMLIAQGKVSQARERVMEGVARNAKDPRFHNLLGRVFVQSRKFAEAEAAFKKAMALDGMLLTNYAHLSELYSRQGKVEQGIREFEAIVSKDPQQLGALMTLGVLHEERKAYPEAVSKYQAALKVNPKFGPAANNLAWILVEHIGDKDSALSYAEAARQALPQDPYVADTLGWIHYHKQMYAKSARLLKEAVDRLPTHPLILYHYGVAQHANKQREQAKMALERFLTLAPDDPHVHEAKTVLAELS